MKIIENWSITLCPRDPYLAPELRKQCLQGLCEGVEIITSPIQRKNEEGNVLTLNSEYVLGESDPVYEELFPNARNRLLRSLSTC